MSCHLRLTHVCSCLALPTFLVAVASAQGLKLSGPLARPIGGDIRVYALSPDGSRVVYVADQDRDEVFELYSAKSTGGGGPIKLAGPAIAGGDVDPSGIAIGPRGRHVVFRGDLETDGRDELWVVSMLGGARVKLSDTLIPAYLGGSDPGAKIDPTEERVVFLAREGLGLPSQLFSVAIAGGAIVRLNPVFPSASGSVSSFRISPDGTRVVYLADPGLDHVKKLFSVPIGGGPSTELSPSGIGGVLNGHGQEFAIDPSGASVVFVADLGVALGKQLFSADLAGEAPARALLSAGLTNVTSVTMSPDGLRVACTIVSAADGVRLVSAPIDGSEPSALLQPGPFPSQPTIGFTPDASFVLILAGANPGPYDLLRAPSDGSSAPVALAQALPYETRISPDGLRVVYSGLDGLYSTRIDGSEAPVRLGAGVAFEITPDAARVVFQAYETSSLDLYSVPITGGSESVQLNPPLPFGGSVSFPGNYPGGFQISSRGGRVLYVADQRADEQFELFSVPADGSRAPASVSGSMPIGPVEGDAANLALDPDGSFAVFAADAETNDRFELFSVRTSGRGQPVRLHEALEPGESAFAFRISPDGSKVAYWFAREIPNTSELRVVPIEGGAPEVLAGPLAGAVGAYPDDTPERHDDGGILFDPSGAWIVFSQPNGPGLFRVRVDGSSPAAPIPGTEATSTATFTPDGSRLVYLAAPPGNNAHLFSVPFDGSAPAVRLDDPSIGVGRVESFVLSDDGSRVVFLSDRFVQYQFEAFVAPVDGSSDPIRLNPPLGVQRIVRSLVTAGDSAFFLSDLAVDDRFELYRAPLDASAPAVKLNAPLVNRGNVTNFRLSPDGSRVVYRADQELDERFELYTSPVDGTGPVRKLNPPLGSGDVVVEDSYPGTRDNFEISPDGKRIAFRAGSSSSTELFTAPIDGSESAVKVGAQPRNGIVLAPFEFTADGRSIVYSAFSPRGFVIFQAPSDRPGEARPLSGTGGRDTYDRLPYFELAPDGRVLFLIDQETPTVFELFFNLVTGGPASVLRR